MEALEVDKKNELQLPIVSQSSRVIPNDIIRSSLFTISNRNRQRDFLSEKSIVTLGSTKIIYTGEELRQDDEDVWMQIIHMASNNESELLEFLPYSFLRELGCPDKTQYCLKLRKTLSRLSATELRFYNEHLKQGYSVSLIRKFYWQDESGNKLKRWRVWLEPEIMALFKKSHYTWVSWGQRKKLTPMGRWLHAFYSSHREPYGIKVTSLHRMTGSKAKRMNQFRADLKKGLEELKRIGFLIDYRIDEGSDLVRVLRNNLEKLDNV